jgi:hypothetical protein
MAVDIKNDSTLSTNLISVWLSDASSLTQDLKGTNTLTNNGTATSTTGKQGTAVELNGSSQYLSLADNADLSPSGAFSFAFWFNVDVITDLKPLLSKWVETSNQRSFAFTFVSGKLRIYMSNDGVNFFVVDSTTTISTGTWYHCSGVFTPSTSLKVYINGTNEATNSSGISASIYNSNAPFEIGHANPFGGGNHYIDGRINQVCFWNKVLTSGEITDLYSSGNGIPYESAGGATYIPKIMMS